jgi:type IX secretion system PorP/SprF family membrane protein
MNLFRNKLLVLFALTTICEAINAQSDPSFRQNQFNAIILNPAQTGAVDRNQVTVHGINSWGGIQGAPKTLSATGNFNLSDEMGFGFVTMNDEIGPVKTTRLGLSSAYHLKLSKNWAASIGLSAMISNVTVNLASLNTTVLNDPHMQTMLNTGTQLRAGMGGLLYSKNFYLGISQPLMGKVNFANVDMDKFVHSTSIVAYTGGVIELNRDWQLRPNLVYRYVNSFPPYIDFTGLVTYDNRIDFGLTYQHQGGAGVLFGVELDNGLYIGYGYTYPTTKLNRATSQSHELALRMSFGKSKKKFGFRNPRFFN